MHPRKAIREQFKLRLLNRTSAEDRVFASRLAPITLDMLQDEGPVVLVYIRNETIKPEDYAASGFDASTRRTLEVVIEAVAKGTETVDDVLDGLAEEIEAVLEDWEVPGFPAAEVRLEETEIDISDAFERPVGSVQLSYVLKYFANWRRDTDPGFIADDVYVVAKETTPREIIVDGPGNDG